MTRSNNNPPKNANFNSCGQTSAVSSYQRPRDEPSEDSHESTVITNVPHELCERVAKRDRIYLLVIAGHFTGQMFRLDSDKMVVGRGSSCELSLADNDISRTHAQLNRLPDGSVIISDLNSTNGTFINGQQIKSCRLQDGDRIQLGRSTILKFSLHDELEELFQQQLYKSAVLDGLTQVYNRKFFDDRLVTEFSYAVRHSTPLSILLLDIDFFKKINDTYGHPAGDEVLRYVSQTIWNAVREEDVVARYGGEEFAVIARGILATQAAILAERIRSTIEQLQVSIQEDTVLSVTVSIGAITMQGQQFSSYEELLQEADDRLYRAKRGGRNQVVAEYENKGTW